MAPLPAHGARYPWPATGASRPCERRRAGLTLVRRVRSHTGTYSPDPRPAGRAVLSWIFWPHDSGSSGPPPKPDANTSIGTPAPSRLHRSHLVGRPYGRPEGAATSTWASVPRCGRACTLQRDRATRWQASRLPVRQHLGPRVARCGGATVTLLGIDRLVASGAFGGDSAGPRSSGVAGPENPSEITRAATGLDHHRPEGRRWLGCNRTTQALTRTRAFGTPTMPLWVSLVR
jgi:hypothetical protein